jgi:hypothetical protein
MLEPPKYTELMQASAVKTVVEDSLQLFGEQEDAWDCIVIGRAYQLFGYVHHVLTSLLICGFLAMHERVGDAVFTWQPMRVY